MSEIKVDKIKSASNPVTVVIESGISVKDENRQTNDQQSFAITENEEIKILTSLNVGSMISTSSGQAGQVLFSRGANFSPMWSNLPTVNCPPPVEYSSLWGVGHANYWNTGSGSGNYFFAFNINTGFDDNRSQTNLAKIGTTDDWLYISKSATAAIKKDGTLWAWGSNKYGLIGNGNEYGAFPTISGLNYSTVYDGPVQIGTDTDWIAVVGGKQNFVRMGLKSDGTLWSWGNVNYNYARGTPFNPWGTQYGGSSGTPGYASPVRVGLNENGISNVNNVKFLSDFGWRYIKTDGTLWAWGNNIDYECGVPNLPDPDWSSLTVDPYYPVQVGTDTNWSYVALTKGIKTDGSLWSWGNQELVGDGRTPAYYPSPAVNQEYPIQIHAGPFKLVTEVMNDICDKKSAFAIKTDGTLWAWGHNPGGECLGLGRGTFPTRSELRSGNQTTLISSIVKTPTQVGTDNNWKDIVAVGEGAIGLKTDGTIWGIGTLTSYITNSGYIYQVFLTPTKLNLGANIFHTHIGLICGFPDVAGTPSHGPKIDLGGGFPNPIPPSDYCNPSITLFTIGKETPSFVGKTISTWWRKGFTSLKSTPCNNGTDTPPVSVPPIPSGWVYCDGLNGTINMKTYVNPVTNKLDWPPIDGADGCGNTPQNINGTLSGQLVYIQKI